MDRRGESNVGLGAMKDREPVWNDGAVETIEASLCGGVVEFSGAGEHLVGRVGFCRGQCWRTVACRRVLGLDGGGQTESQEGWQQGGHQRDWRQQAEFAHEFPNRNSG